MIRRLLAVCDTPVAGDQTILEMDLPDGQARALVVLPPIALANPYLVIRKMPPVMIS